MLFSTKEHLYIQALSQTVCVFLMLSKFKIFLFQREVKMCIAKFLF